MVALSRLEARRKWLLASSVILALSAILPWYEDVDAFGAGDLYLGVTGPLFLVGLMVLASALFVAGWVVLPAMGRRVPKLPIKEGALFTSLGLQNLLLLLVANSVFFHPKFGVNITFKNTKFGMILALAGAIVLVWSGYSYYKSELKRTAHLTPEGKLEPLIKMPENSKRVTSSSPYNGSQAGQDMVTRATQNINRAADRPVQRYEPIERNTGDKPAPQPLRMDL